MAKQKKGLMRFTKKGNETFTITLEGPGLNTGCQAVGATSKDSGGAEIVKWENVTANATGNKLKILGKSKKLNGGKAAFMPDVVGDLTITVNDGAGETVSITVSNVDFY